MKEVRKINFQKKQAFFITVLTAVVFTTFIMPIQSLAASGDGIVIQSEVQATFVYGEENSSNEVGDENIQDDSVEDGEDNISGDGAENNITGDVRDNMGSNSNEDSIIPEDGEIEENGHLGNQGLFPQTGDFSNVPLIILALIFSFGALVIMLKLRKSKE